MDASTILNAALLLFIVVGLLFTRYVEKMNRKSQKDLDNKRDRTQ